MHYNFCRIHQTLRVTSAMEAGIADHVWGLDEVVSQLDENIRVAAQALVDRAVCFINSLYFWLEIFFVIEPRRSSFLI